MLKRLTYVSRFAHAMDEEQLMKIGDHAESKNRELGITGVLMTSGGLFYQVLEGPAAPVDELYAEITADDRHTDLVLLSAEEEVQARQFPDWSMKTVNLDAAAHVRLLPLKALIKTVFEQKRLVDNMVWAIERTVRYEMGSTDLGALSQQSSDL